MITILVKMKKNCPEKTCYDITITKFLVSHRVWLSWRFKSLKSVAYLGFGSHRVRLSWGS